MENNTIKESCKSQFLTVKDEAIDLSEKGHSKKAIYDYLVKAGKI